MDSDYDLNFPARGTTDYALYEPMPSLDEFTFCLWMKSSASTDMLVLFSYAVKSYADAVVMFYTVSTSKLHFQIALSPSWRYLKANIFSRVNIPN